MASRLFQLVTDLQSQVALYDAYEAAGVAPPEGFEDQVCELLDQVVDEAGEVLDYDPTPDDDNPDDDQADDQADDDQADDG